ncbi:GHMP kinase [Endomicrobiia bacterium]|nr:GHMP kinase [Endomicrobiia bacterium]GHT75809.1 GHMP kinase [Endomicrobiia bacterium]
MIITRTPFRISFAGGGSDISSYYEKFGGAVVSTTINKYVYLSMHPLFFKDKYFLKYSQTEHTDSLNYIQHSIIREVFRMYGICGVDFNSSADIPSGTGLASSSAFTAGLINLCNAYNRRYCDKKCIAEHACDIEINHLGEPIGKQDQYACACGGLNFIEFNPNGSVDIERLFLSNDVYYKLEKNLLMFYTGRSRKTNVILTEQKNSIECDTRKIENLHKMVSLARELKTELLHGNVDSIGEILHTGWMYKKELAANISNEGIDLIYELGCANGASGGKLLGAGGGGFVLFYAKEENHNRLRAAMHDYSEVNFKFDNNGTQVIHNDNYYN